MFGPATSLQASKHEALGLGLEVDERHGDSGHPFILVEDRLVRALLPDDEFVFALEQTWNRKASGPIDT